MNQQPETSDLQPATSSKQLAVGGDQTPIGLTRAAPADRQMASDPSRRRHMPFAGMEILEYGAQRS
jgi:hypothetical protein